MSRFLHENPWDSESGNGSGNRPTERRFGLTAAAFVFAWLFLPVLGSAQSPAPVPIQDDPRAVIIDRGVLGEECMEIAQDYQDLLLDIVELAQDFHDTRVEDDNEIYLETIERLDDLIEGIEDGDYYDKPDRLNADLLDLSVWLLEQEQKLEGNRSQKRLYSSIRWLRREININSNILTEDIIDRMNERGKEKSTRVENYRESIAAYVKELLENRKALQKYKNAIVVDREALELAMKAAEQALRDVEASGALDIRVQETPTVERGPTTASVPSLDDLPKPGSLKVYVAPPANQTIIYKSGKGNAATYRRFSDSTGTVSPSTQVLVSSTGGKVSITGWNKNYVSASFEVEIEGSDENRLEKLADRVGLSLREQGNQILVSSKLPPLRDPDIEFSSVKLSVQLPFTNKIVCNSSMNELDIRNLVGGLKFNGQNSTLDATDINGPMNIQNSMGAVVLSRCNGEVEIINAMGLIKLDECTAGANLENTLSEIYVTNSEGHLEIKSSGDIDIQDHRGPVVIDNRNGVVTVRSLEGNLRASNSFKPMFIESIIGDTELESMNSVVNARDLKGGLKAFVKFGQLVASQIQGPVDLSSQSGTIDFSLTKLYDGSSIEANYGTVNLLVDSRLDGTLDLRTTFGDINSFVAADITNEGEHKTAKIDLGNGSPILIVQGKSTNITVTESR